EGGECNLVILDAGDVLHDAFAVRRPGIDAEGEMSSRCHRHLLCPGPMRNVKRHPAATKLVGANSLSVLDKAALSSARQRRERPLANPSLDPNLKSLL